VILAFIVGFAFGFVAFPFVMIAAAAWLDRHFDMPE
jgi:hypothetical protein